MVSIIDFNQLDSDSTAFLLCDIQEKFRPAIDHFDSVVEVAAKLVNASKILNIPLIVTEQYPKGLGQTVAELDISHAALKLEKTKFTMFNEQVEQFLRDKSIKTIVLFGVEAHVCVLQTSIDLMKNGFVVHLAVDATSSRSKVDRLYAFERLRQMNVVVTTTESILFQLIGDKNHEKFKEIQTLVKNVSSNTGLL